MNGNHLGMEIGKLGFGLMRLPEIDGVIDIEQVKKMADLFIENGFTYFDSGYGYHGGKSEVAIKDAITSRYPRDKVQIATKLPLWNMEVDPEKIFNEQLERTGAGYFDYYLIH
jgi:predicted aldo/keto reductase-like oxidoreductase